MTDQLFFDTDCLSAFLWVRNQSLLATLYPGRIVIPAQVYKELSYPSTPQLKERVDEMIAKEQARVESFDVGSEMFELYIKLTASPDPGHTVIGPGEAAGIVLAKAQNGILASNNLRDVKRYVDEYGLKLVTTGDILKEACERKLLTESEADSIWHDMLNKRRRLGYKTFYEFLEANQ
ncbi:MAG: hypothetical protein IJU46_02515 [Clostridia bacterium]|nr:hypothetical protein [Clostridia bacterium]